MRVMNRIKLPVRNILQRNFLLGWNVVLMGILLSATPVAAQQAPASPQLIEDLVAATAFWQTRAYSMATDT